MSIDPLLPHVRDLLRHRIESVAQLNLLLFMHNRREREWTAADASAELRISLEWTRAQLERLVQLGLLACKETLYRYAASRDLDLAVVDLARAYQAFPVTVVGAIYADQDSTLRGFAEAFRVRRSPDPDARKEPPSG